LSREYDIRCRVLAPARREEIFGIVRDWGLRSRGLRADILGGSVRGGAVDVHSRFPWAASHATLEDDAVRVEAGDLLDGVFDITQSHSVAPVDVEHSDEDVVDLG
jgi:hypothetical protein